MRIAIGNDHGGVELKNELKQYLEEKGHTVINFGSDTNERVDYPLYGFKIGEAVGKKEVDYGIAICRSAIGIAVACNKVKGVRCGAMYNVEDAKHAKTNDYINTIALGGERLTLDEAKAIIDVFLATNALDDPVYLKRKNQIEAYEIGENYGS